MEGVPLPHGISGFGGSTDPLEAILGPFPCARLRNLPFDASIEEILQLFQGLVVIDVVVIGHGEAFVIFANPMDFQMALQRSGQTLGRRYVDIGPSSRADYYEAIATQHMNEKEHERRAEFSAAASISDELRGDEHQSGESAAVAALWRSTSPLADTHGYSRFGGLGVPGLPSLMGGVPGSLGGVLHAPIQKRAGGGLQVGEHTGFLRMRGLPFSVGKEDILSFFLEYNPIPDSIVLTYRNDGRATGEAYIGFTNPEDSLRAMDLHRRSMGSRYIELFISNKEEHGRALARFGSR